ncbi:MAG: hypothetical protein U0231_16460 [Nitrospiraceae bacterium]
MNNSAEARLLPGPILGIETSCDETAAAVLTPDGRVLSNIISSQQIVHERFGGVVPELAARAHIQNVEAVVKKRLCRQPRHARASRSDSRNADLGWPAHCSWV